MFRRWIGLLALAPTLLLGAGESWALTVKIIDSNTGAAAPGAKIILSDGPSAAPINAEMVQKNRQFQPKTLVVTKGSEVNFPNQDATQHHVYSFSPAKVFNLELFADQPERPVVFDQTGVVEVGCNIHDQMQGFILVTNSDLNVTTSAAGIADIALPESMATGDLSLGLWHPRLVDTTRTVDFTITLPAPELLELELDLTPEPESTGRLDSLQKRFQDL